MAYEDENGWWIKFYGLISGSGIEAGAAAMSREDGEIKRPASRCVRRGSAA